MSNSSIYTSARIICTIVTSKFTKGTPLADQMSTFPMTVPFGVIRAFGLVTVLAAVFVQCSEIHKLMTDAEIHNIFHTRRDNVPEYEVIILRHNMYSRRAARRLRLQFNAFGRRIDAYLNPTDSFLAGRNTPVWLAATQPDGAIEYKKMRNDITGIVVGMYSSYTTTDSILAWQRSNDTVAFQGFIDDMIIRSLPDRLKASARDNRYFEFPNTNRTLLETHHHIIIKSHATPGKNETSKPLLAQIEGEHRSPSKRSTKDIVFPSVFVAVDYRSSKNLDNDLEFYDEIIYQLAFWNAVDLRFRSVSNPKMRLRIAGMIFALDREATPYLNEYRQGDRWVVFPKDFSDISRHWSELNRRPDFPQEAYHMVVTLTDNDISIEHNDTQLYRVAGIGSVGSLCPKKNEKFDAFAVVNDNGGFRGVLAAVHEIGHIIGLQHDEDIDSDCGAVHNFIMGTNSPSANNLRWSRCSLSRLSQLLRDNRMDCIDEPASFHNPGTAVRIILPGTIEDANKQCRAHRYTSACNVGSSICTSMKCAPDWGYENRTELCIDVGPAAEGTACSDGHVCLNGFCQCLTNDCLYS